jgi:hypothetical protein
MYYNVASSKIPEKPPEAKPFSILFLTLFIQRPFLSHQGVALPAGLILFPTAAGKAFKRNFRPFALLALFFCHRLWYYVVSYYNVLYSAGYQTGLSRAGLPSIEHHGSSSSTNDPSTRLRFPARVSIYL